MKEFGYSLHIAANAHILSRTFGHSESLCAFETLQFEDYSKVVFSYFDPEERKERRKTVFPKDLERAYELGVRFGQSG
jgi:hypothetical protein